MSSDVHEAIERARQHLRAATRESIEATRALVDAALLAGGMDAAGPGGLATEVRTILDTWIEALDQDQAFRMPAALVEPLEQALQAEIDRWEKRSASDPTARPVLRAFLGLRELLWELGMRGSQDQDSETSRNQAKPRSAASTAAAANPAAKGAPTHGPRSRVQRFNLED